MRSQQLGLNAATEVGYIHTHSYKDGESQKCQGNERIEMCFRWPKYDVCQDYNQSGCPLVDHFQKAV